VEVVRYNPKSSLRHLKSEKPKTKKHKRKTSLKH